MQSASARNNPALIVHKKTATLCDRVAVFVGAYLAVCSAFCSILTTTAVRAPCASIAATMSAGSLTETLTVGCPYLTGRPFLGLESTPRLRRSTGVSSARSIPSDVCSLCMIVPIPGTNAPGKVARPTGEDTVVKALTIGPQLSHLARHIVSCYLPVNMHGSP